MAYHDICVIFSNTPTHGACLSLNHQSIIMDSPAEPARVAGNATMVNNWDLTCERQQPYIRLHALDPTLDKAWVSMEIRCYSQESSRVI